jgi:hypothetical protein
MRFTITLPPGAAGEREKVAHTWARVGRPGRLSYSPQKQPVPWQGVNSGP